MITKEYIHQLLAEKLQGTEIFVVDVKVSPANRIDVFVDAMNGLTIKNCVDISRHIEGSIDREQEDFELNVSSPGAEEPFKVKQQYEKNAGRNVQVNLKDGREFKGVLKGLKQETVLIETAVKKDKEKGKGKILVKEESAFDLNEVVQTKIILAFK